MSGAKILLVDDDQDLVRWLTAQLRTAGFQVVSAGDGATAMMRAQKERPDAVILDIGLPGAAGQTVIRRLRSLAPLAAVPIIVLTGRMLSAEEEKDIQAQTDGIFHKPADIDELVTAIRTALPGTGS